MSPVEEPHYEEDSPEQHNQVERDANLEPRELSGLLDNSLNSSVELPTGRLSGDDLGHQHDGLGDELMFETALNVLNEPTTTTTIPVSEGSNHHERNLYSGGVYLANGIVLLVPARAAHILSVDVNKRTVHTIGANLGEMDGKFSGGVHVRGCVYLIPGHATHVLR